MKKEIAHPIAATMEQANERKVFGETDFSHHQSTTPTERKQGPIERLLLHGQENAQSVEELAKLAGLRSTRELQLQIAREREAGALILSTCRGGGGYFLPSDGEAGQREIGAFVATLRARAINTLRVLKAAREALEGLDGQVSLDDLEGM